MLIGISLITTPGGINAWHVAHLQAVNTIFHYKQNDDEIEFHRNGLNVAQARRDSAL